MKWNDQWVKLSICRTCDVAKKTKMYVMVRRGKRAYEHLWFCSFGCARQFCARQPQGHD